MKLSLCIQKVPQRSTLCNWGSLGFGGLWTLEIDFKVRKAYGRGHNMLVLGFSRFWLKVENRFVTLCIPRFAPADGER